MRAEDLVDAYLARLGDDWIAYFSAPECGRDDDPRLFNPWGVVIELVHHSPLHAWGLIQYILAEDGVGQTLGLLSAGPLEDFISIHGCQWIEWIEEAGRENPRFRSLLAGVWQLNTPDEIWDRITTVRGNAEPFGQR